MREKLRLWVFEAVQAADGEASVLDVAKHIWANHNDEIERAGDSFFTWQYDMRWAAQRLRNEGQLGISPSRKWCLVKTI